jgi:hypothetical protein
MCGYCHHWRCCQTQSEARSLPLSHFGSRLNARSTACQYRGSILSTNARASANRDRRFRLFSLSASTFPNASSNSRYAASSATCRSLALLVMLISANRLRMPFPSHSEPWVAYLLDSFDVIASRKNLAAVLVGHWNVGNVAVHQRGYQRGFPNLSLGFERGSNLCARNSPRSQPAVSRDLIGSTSSTARW